MSIFRNNMTRIDPRLLQQWKRQAAGRRKELDQRLAQLERELEWLSARRQSRVERAEDLVNKAEKCRNEAERLDNVIRHTLVPSLEFYSLIFTGRENCQRPKRGRRGAIGECEDQ